MKDFYRLAAKASFFFTVGVLLASLFVWCLIQGILVHSAGDAPIAFAYYFVAWLAGNAAVGNYFQARSMFRFARLA